MKNAHEINAKIGQAIKATIETLEEAYLCSHCQKLENRLMAYVNNANSEDMTVDAYVRRDDWDNFAAVVFTVATSLRFKSEFIAQVQKAVTI